MSKCFVAHANYSLILMNVKAPNRYSSVSAHYLLPDYSVRKSQCQQEAVFLLCSDSTALLY